MALNSRIFSLDKTILSKPSAAAYAPNPVEKMMTNRLKKAWLKGLLSSNGVEEYYGR